MPATPWNWKAKDRVAGGLLYESGNWGDCIKLLWLDAIVRWKKLGHDRVNYFDPFAGDVHYPIGKKTAFRLGLFPVDVFPGIREHFLNHDRWPSAAAAMAGLCGGHIEVWDFEPERRSHWHEIAGVKVIATAAGLEEEEEDGWRLLLGKRPDPDAIWLIDPYDFLAEWRTHLPLILQQSRHTSILLYIYNRAGKSPEAFREYRAFRNALEDGRPDLPKRLGRAAADAFMPNSYHEMLFLPSNADSGRDDLYSLFGELGHKSWLVGEALRKAAVYDC